MAVFSKDYADMFRAFIEAHEFFYIVGHKEPDGDCVASCLGIAAILDHLKKPYKLLSAGPFKRTDILKFEPLFSNELDFQTSEEIKNTGLIIVDCSELHRLGELDGDVRNYDTFIIDHHKTSGDPAKDNPSTVKFIDPNSPACSYLVQLFYETIIGPIPKETAETLFLGFCTDTGFFRFLNENSDPYIEGAARLVKYGAIPRETYRTINSGKPFSTRKLLGILLERTELYLDGKLALTYETLNDTKQYGQEGRDSDALYSALLSCRGVEAVVFLRQDSINTCTGGFRSQDKVDVSVVAQKFNGGGHKNASGLSTEGRLETLIPAIVKEFARVMN